jgi:hypothetical protein
MVDPLPEPPQLVRQDGIYRPAVCQADSPVLTQKFRRLSAQKPQLPVVVAHTIVAIVISEAPGIATQ